MKKIIPFLILCILGLADIARADDRSDAIAAAKAITQEIGRKRFDSVWDTKVSDWFKKHIGSKDSFVANLSLGRSNLGSLESSSVIDAAYMNNDPASGFVGDIYVVNFRNKYSNTSLFERIVVIKESGSWKLSGFFGVAAPDN